MADVTMSFPGNGTEPQFNPPGRRRPMFSTALLAMGDVIVVEFAHSA